MVIATHNQKRTSTATCLPIIKIYQQKRKSTQNIYADVINKIRFKKIYSILQHQCQARAKQVQQECDTSDTQTTKVRHEWKILILITERVETYFRTPILAEWQMKDYKETSNFILRTNFWKCLVPIPKCVWKVSHNNWTL